MTDLEELLEEIAAFDLDAVLEEIARESERLLAGLSCQLYPDNPDT